MVADGLSPVLPTLPDFLQHRDRACSSLCLQDLAEYLAHSRGPVVVEETLGKPRPLSSAPNAWLFTGGLDSKLSKALLLCRAV